MKKIYFILSILAALSFVACEEINDVLEEVDELSTEEVVSGLKTALVVGTDSSVTYLSAVDGYYKNEALKILLPDEADVIIDNLDNQVFQSLGVSDFLQQQVDEMVLRINRSAEDAATEAAPIFKSSITNLTLDKAWDILNGTNPEAKGQAAEFDSLAATHYLMSTTFTQLSGLFQPKINNSLDKPLVAGVSTNQAWDEVQATYNQGAETVAGQILGLQSVNIQLSEHVTNRALDGLFLKVGEEEKKIRRDPLAWATSAVGDILNRVFGDQGK